ncbi:hypothetical protein A2704_06755 [Candidatus Kaiserbacteria bacterium RIFCSPHIGHO2_01_FULL_54_36b]|uniref:Large-conductance mechanosensitive channel n=1 Tax=Candidatus Kaiserbacteria bacterium RIFCSPHIGHO2_01_FULL_54_36b TaxID=1798483 RepID=A0A1F6CRZ8_9BACT|nr:MAG: hypothetical protein A2704_06755 [Candidatus Kaiserbacteria bacterium RIFCSPHIGHO2_01_FULL_54_36b]
MKGFLKEFETFAVRGNAIDLAVGVVIGAAFGQITTAFASGILTPPIGLLLGGVDFTKLAVSIGGGAQIAYGLLIEAFLNFILIALALFLLLKLFNRLAHKRKQEEKKSEDSPQLKVLAEIRDILKAQ